MLWNFAYKIPTEVIPVNNTRKLHEWINTGISSRGLRFTEMLKIGHYSANE